MAPDALTVDRVPPAEGDLMTAAAPVPGVERLEAKLLQLPQLDIPVTNRFAPGVYMREVLMPKGAFVIGHRHKTEHLNIVLRGRARVMMDGELHDIVGPCTFTSKPGVRKLLYILEDTQWATIHPTEETDLLRLEEALISKSDAFEQRQAELELNRLKAQLGGAA